MRYVAGLIAGLVSGVVVHAAEFDAATGSFRCGDKWLRAGGIGFTIYAGGKKVCRAHHYFSTKAGAYINKERKLKDGKREGGAAGATSYTARVPLDRAATKTAGFASRVWLQADGTVRFTTRVTFDDPADRKLYKNGEIQILMDRAMLAGELIRIGERDFEVPATAPAKGGNIHEGGPQRIEYYATDPAKSFVIRAITGRTRIMYAGNSLSSIEARIIPEDGATDFVLELPPSGIAPEPPSENAFAGIDFLKRDGFRVPNYRLCRNLVQNPSFEAGFHYWSPARIGGTYKLDFDDFVSIDEREAFRGRRSLCIRIRKGETPPLANHFAIPVVKGETYTFSFHAKADRDGVQTSVLSITQHWAKFPLSKRILLTRAWKRYSFEITAPNRILHIGLGERWWDDEKGEQLDGARIWIDGVQLERGKLTDYAEKPLVAELATGKFGNVYEVDEPKNPTFSLHNQTSKDRTVTVTLTVRDFFGRQRYRDVFEIPLKGRQSRSRSVSLDDAIGTGYYIVSVEIDDGAFKDADAFRLAVIRPLDNRHRNKNLFSGNGTVGRAIWLPRKLDLVKRVGIGSVVNNRGPFPGKAVYDLLARHRIRTLACITRKDRIGKAKLYEKETYTPAGLREIEEAAYKTVKAYPWETYWKLRNEPDALPGHWEGVTWEQMVAGFQAAYRGIKRANPRAKVVSPDPCNMYARARNWMDRYLRAGGLKTFDILAVHPYRATPEDPDLDTDSRRFLELADQHGYKGPVWWTEGNYYAPYTISELGLTAYKGCSSDFYRGGPLSYELGRSERIAAAWTARSFLVGLKYHKRVDMNVDWSTGKYYFMDLEMTMRPVMFAVNTPGNLLGNAVYRQDVDLGAGIRTYVYEDEQRRPIAAIWNHDIKVNKFEKQPASGVFPFDTGEVSVLDFMMEKRVLPDGASFELELGPYPVFLIGKPGSLASFAKRLEKTVIKGVELVPFNVATRMNGSRATITFQSLLSRGVMGTCDVLLGGKPAGRAKIAIKGKKEQQLAVDVAPYLRPGRVTDVPLSVRFTGARGKQQEIDAAFRVATCPKRRRPIRIDGDLADWSGVPAVKLGKTHLTTWRRRREAKDWAGPQDLSAALRTAWDETGFYLSVDVTDDALDMQHRKGGLWARDSVQVYFDTWADARFRKARGFDNNDYAYLFALTDDGPTALRDTVPEWQIAFLKTGTPETVRTAIRRTGNHTVYEVFMPKSELVPIEFTSGTSFGFALLVNDKDNDYRKQGLTLTPAGTEPHMNPHLWPVWVLGEMMNAE